MRVQCCRDAIVEPVLLLKERSMAYLFQLVLALLALVSSTTPPPNPNPAPVLVAPELALVGATLIDGTGSAPIPDAVILIGGGRILGVGTRASMTIPPGTPVRNLRGTTLLPGFVNAHAHSEQLTAEQMRTWTRAGVTTIRDLGGPLADLVQRRTEASNDPTLPRMLITGPIMTVPGGHPIPVSGHDASVITVQGPTDAGIQATKILTSGADLIKIAVSGRTDVRWPELSNAEIAAISAAAHARTARVSAHVDRAVALRRAVEQGISDAAHSPRDRVPDSTFQLMADHGVAFVPTIDVYENLAEERGIAAAWRRTTRLVMYDNLRRAHAAGVTLALGDDYGNPRVRLGIPLDEITHWQQAGIQPLEIIRAATLGGAIVCGLADEIGSLEVGKQADILVVDGDLMRDIRILERPVLVLHHGQIVYER